MAGCGRNIKTIKEIFPSCQVTVIDQDDKMIRAAKKSSKIKAIVINVKDIKWEDHESEYLL